MDSESNDIKTNMDSESNENKIDMDSESSDIKTNIALFFSDKVVAPLKRTWLAIIAFFKNLSFFSPQSSGLEDKNTPAEPITDEKWKEEALEEFKQWLSEMPTADSRTNSVTPDSCDLYSLLTEFVALRQEIKMQNREQHRTVAALNSVKSVTDEYGQIFQVFRERTNQLAQLEQNIRLNCEKKSATHFFDVRDSLVRGHRASVEIAAKRGFFTRPPKGIEKICEGYEMTINRFDKALSLMDIEPVETFQVPFDSQTMKAVETRKVLEGTDGMVLETVSGGFIRGKEVMRHAKVVVAHAPEALAEPEPDALLEAPEKAPQSADASTTSQNVPSN